MHTLLSFAVLAMTIATTLTATVQQPHDCPMTAAQALAAAASTDRSALTADQIQQLMAGEGMGQAKAAESTGYPGPKHVLEMADRLTLTPAQRAAVTSSYEQVNADARQLGAQIVQAERDLYAAFQSHSVTAGDIDALTTRIGHLQAGLRARHLRAHLETMKVLTAEQVAEYARLRAQVH